MTDSNDKPRRARKSKQRALNLRELSEVIAQREHALSGVTELEALTAGIRRVASDPLLNIRTLASVLGPPTAQVALSKLFANNAAQVAALGAASRQLQQDTSIAAVLKGMPSLTAQVRTLTQRPLWNDGSYRTVGQIIRRVAVQAPQFGYSKTLGLGAAISAVATANLPALAEALGERLPDGWEGVATSASASMAELLPESEAHRLIESDAALARFVTKVDELTATAPVGKSVAEEQRTALVVHTVLVILIFLLTAGHAEWLAGRTAVVSDRQHRELVEAVAQVADAAKAGQQPRRYLARVTVRLREGPSTEERVRRLLEAGTEVVLRDCDQGWCFAEVVESSEASADRITGWIYKRNLDPVLD